jgi:hypothetical protein
MNANFLKDFSFDQFRNLVSEFDTIVANVKT